MVTWSSRKMIYLILIIILTINLPKSIHALTPANVSQIQYRIDKEWVVVWINVDGSIELHYNITITYQSSAEGYITIGMPAQGFIVSSVKDLSGNPLSYTDVSGMQNYPDFGVEVYFGHQMSPGSSGTLVLIATVPNMLFPDTMNPGNWGMEFIPTYYDATVVDLRLAIVPPEGVTKDNIQTSEVAYLTTVDGSFAVYWTRSNVQPNTQLTFGVSMPEQHLNIITCGLSSTDVSKGSEIIISGTISAGASTPITIRVSIDNGATWSTLATVYSASDRTYSYTWTPTAAGTYMVEAAWLGDPTHPSATSSTVILTVSEAAIWLYLIIVALIVAVIAIFIFLYRRFHKAIYEKPKVSIEALGAARGLTAVEAAVVVGSKPIRVLTMILFGMLRKRFVMVKEISPLIKLEMVDVALRETSPPRYYEIDYLKAVKPDGSLDEMDLARVYLGLRDNVDRKLRGYSRVDTVNYYKSVVDRAWNQVRQAGTPELKGEAIDRNLEWLLTDENYDSKFKQALPPNMVIMPSPGWWWYWHGPASPRGPISTPSTSPKTPVEFKPIPAQEWANDVVQGLETAANNMVKNVQDFTNRLLAPQAARTIPSSRPVRQGSSCVCACAHCACACACVSCACACAQGGAR